MKKYVALFLVFIFTFVNLSSAFANEKAQNNQFNLMEIQEIAVKNSRNLKKLDLIMNQSQHLEYIYDNEYDKARANSMGRYIMSSSDRTKKASADSLIAGYEAAYGFDESTNPATLDPSLISAYNTYANAKLTSAMLETSMTSTTSIVSGQLDILSVYGLADSNSLTKELKTKKEDAENTNEDLKVTKVEAEKQIELTSGLLALKAIEMKKSINLLENVYELYLKLCDVERLKMEQGLSNKNSVDELAVKASDYQKQLNYAQENLKILHSKINDLMGRDINEPLEISEFTIPESIIPAPDLSSILTTSVEKTYEFKILDRTIEDLEDDVEDATGSNKKTIKKREVEKVKLDKEEKLIEIENKLKKILADYKEKAKTYQLALVDFNRAEREFKWDEIKLESCLISKIMFRNSEINYLKAKTQKINAAYNYYLVQQELELAKEGIWLPESYYATKANFK